MRKEWHVALITTIADERERRGAGRLCSAGNTSKISARSARRENAARNSRAADDLATS